MHAAQYTTTPISWALKRAKKSAARADKLAARERQRGRCARLVRPGHAMVRGTLQT